VGRPDRDVLDTVLRFGRLGVTVLVLALTVGDAALVTAALQRTHRSDPSVVASNAVPPPVPSATPSAAISTPAPTKQPGSHVVAVTDGKHALFTAETATTAWRAHGGCTGTPNLSRTTDGARTWSALTSPAPHLLRIDLTGAQSGWAVGVNGSCSSPTYYGTVDGGATWAASPTLGNVWLPLKAGVRSPSGASTSPCGHAVAPRGLAPSGTSGAVAICPTGVMRTTDAGTTWKPVGRLAAGQSVAAALDAHGTGVLVLTGAPKCGGLRVLTTADVGATWKTGTCLTDAIEPASVGIGASGAGLLISAGRAYATTDSGLHWS
jgi:photosystem II stability/assembly factor-like uncharacterized protein